MKVLTQCLSVGLPLSVQVLIATRHTFDHLTHSLPPQQQGNALHDFPPGCNSHAHFAQGKIPTRVQHPMLQPTNESLPWRESRSSRWAREVIAEESRL